MNKRRMQSLILCVSIIPITQPISGSLRSRAQVTS
jgi:hypothetical protein